TADEPLSCMGEASEQLLRDTDEAIPLAPGRPAREGYHDERRGTQALFLSFDPLRGWRRVSRRDSRTRLGWAGEVRRPRDEDCPQARRVRRVCDDLNAHAIARLYEAFPAAEAHRPARRLEIHHAPRNGSRPNVAGIELSALARQCPGRRLGSA